MFLVGLTSVFCTCKSNKLLETGYFPLETDGEHKTAGTFNTMYERLRHNLPTGCAPRLAKMVNY